MDGWMLLILAILPGVFSGNWGVFFQNQCAVRGTSVVMQCSYDYPFAQIVAHVIWYKGVGGRLRPFSQLPSPPDVQYEGNKRGKCDLRINNVRTIDEGRYYFHFDTVLDQWTSKTSAQLSVTELSASLERSTVTEGDTVRMTCDSGCPQYISTVWFKDGERVLTSVFIARRERAGKYRCAVRGQESSSSNWVTLDVLYAPKNVMLSLSPPGGALKGTSVTFTCSSEANPPVAPGGYSLYKDGLLLSSGSKHIISALQPGNSGVYHCAARNNVSRGGHDVQNSSAVILDVQYAPQELSVSVDPSSQLGEGSSVNLTCSGEANPAVHNYTWYRRTDSPDPNSSAVLQVGSGQVMSLHSVEASHTGLYFCRAWNGVGEATSDEVLLTLKKDGHGVQSHQIIGGVAVAVLVLVFVVLLLYWKTQRNLREQRQTVLDSHLSGKDSSYSDDPTDAIYANIQAPSSSHHRSSYYTPSAEEAEVTYTTVAIKPKNRARQQYRHKETERQDPVIYSTVVQYR